MFNSDKRAHINREGLTRGLTWEVVRRLEEETESLAKGARPAKAAICLRLIGPSSGKAANKVIVVFLPTDLTEEITLALSLSSLSLSMH